LEIICPSYVNTALKLLKESGFKSYAVGGCVRDILMGREPNDWDMTTSALPDETLNVFKEYRTIPTGLKHGTVTVLIDGQPLEITTMRIDGEYHDSRRPDSVEFTDEITIDLSRRDFTANAIAYNPDDGIIDPFGGQTDIKNKVIRCVGNPDKRFDEDALRIIRALRFASVLGFDIDPETSESIMKNHHLMQNVAAERIRVELVKLLSGKNVEKLLTEYKDVVFGIIPELKDENGFAQHTPYHAYDIWTHTVKVVGAIQNEPAFRVAALLHDIAKPSCFNLDENGIGHFPKHAPLGAEMAFDIMKRLHFSNAEIKTVCTMIKLHYDRPDGSKSSIARLCSEYSVEDVRNTIELIKADAAGKAIKCYDIEISRCKTAENQLAEIEAEKLPLKVSELNINGTELLEIGLKGKEIKDTLNALLDMVIDGKIDNKNEILVAEAKRLK